MITEQYIFQINAVDKILKNFYKLHLQIHTNIVI